MKTQRLKIVKMNRPKIHLDMDTSRRDLHKALVSKGFDVTRTPNPDIVEDASDEYQLLWATSHNRIIFTFNIKDFLNLSKKHPTHSGIILANQKSASLDKMISELSRILEETSADSWTGLVRWLSGQHFSSSHIPNAETERTIKDSLTGNNLHSAKDVDDLSTQLSRLRKS